MYHKGYRLLFRLLGKKIHQISIAEQFSPLSDHCQDAGALCAASVCPSASTVQEHFSLSTYRQWSIVKQKSRARWRGVAMGEIRIFCLLVYWTCQHQLHQTKRSCKYTQRISVQESNTGQSENFWKL